MKPKKKRVPLKAKKLKVPAKKPVKATRAFTTEQESKQAQLVLALTLQTMNLELMKDEYLELAPLPGCCGPFKLTGNTLPVFEYRVFEKALMEFILVRVEVSRPARIDFIATVDSAKTTDPKRHGEAVPMKEKYKEPFVKLAWHLFNYFPYYRARGNGVKKEQAA